MRRWLSATATTTTTTTDYSRLFCNHGKQFLLVIRVRRGVRMNRPLLYSRDCIVGLFVLVRLCFAYFLLFSFFHIDSLAIILIVIRTNEREREREALEIFPSDNSIVAQKIGVSICLMQNYTIDYVCIRRLNGTNSTYTNEILDKEQLFGYHRLMIER